MFGTRMLLIYPAVVFNADVPHLGPRVGGEGNPSCEEQNFSPARPYPGRFSSLAEASGPCPMGLACFAVACVFHDSNPRSHVRKIVRTVVSQFLMSLYFLFPT